MQQGIWKPLSSFRAFGMLHLFLNTQALFGIFSETCDGQMCHDDATCNTNSECVCNDGFSGDGLNVCEGMCPS